MKISKQKIIVLIGLILFVFALAFYSYLKEKQEIEYQEKVNKRVLERGALGIDL